MIGVKKEAGPLLADLEDEAVAEQRRTGRAEVGIQRVMHCPVGRREPVEHLEVRREPDHGVPEIEAAEQGAAVAGADEEIARRVNRGPGRPSDRPSRPAGTRYVPAGAITGASRDDPTVAVAAVSEQPTMSDIQHALRECQCRALLVDERLGAGRIDRLLELNTTSVSGPG